MGVNDCICAVNSNREIDAWYRELTDRLTSEDMTVTMGALRTAKMWKASKEKTKPHKAPQMMPKIILPGVIMVVLQGSALGQACYRNPASPARSISLSFHSSSSSRWPITK